jgi:hypothetical protein
MHKRGGIGYFRLPIFLFCIATSGTTTRVIVPIQTSKNSMSKSPLNSDTLLIVASPK